jgi:hypothetical protein
MSQSFTHDRIKPLWNLKLAPKEKKKEKKKTSAGFIDSSFVDELEEVTRRKAAIIDAKAAQDKKLKQRKKAEANLQRLAQALGLTRSKGLTLTLPAMKSLYQSQKAFRIEGEVTRDLFLAEVEKHETIAWRGVETGSPFADDFEQPDQPYNTQEETESKESDDEEEDIQESEDLEDEEDDEESSEIDDNEEKQTQQVPQDAPIHTRSGRSIKPLYGTDEWKL